METIPAKAIPDFLQGGGEMGDLTRNYNWSFTSLGDPGQWPQSLRTTLSILLHSKFPMFLFWGDELLCFYNDAYRPSLGNEGKHPYALGKPGAAVWPEIWPVIKPLIDQVLSGGEATWSEDQLLPIYRNGKMEDVYWTFSYSPVSDESGRPAGVFVTCMETTETVAGRKKVVESEERFRRLADQVPQFIWMTGSTGIDVTYINKPFLDFLGLDHYNEFLGSTWETLMHPDDIQHVYDVYGAAFTGRQPYRLQARYKQGDGSAYRWFLLQGVPRYEAGGTFAGFIGTGLDINESKEAEEALTLSEAKFRSLVEEAPIATCLFVGRDMMIEIANQRMIEVWGKGAGVLGIPLAQALPELSNQHFLSLLDNLFTTGRTYEAKEDPVSLEVNGVLGTYYFNYTFKPVRNLAGEVYAILEMAEDVTAQVLSKRALEESERNLRNIILQAPVAMAILRGPAFMVEIANDRMFELWGRGKEELLNKALFEGLPEVKNQGYEELLNSVFTTGKTFSAFGVPVTLPRYGGLETVYINLLYEAFREGDGTLSGVMAVATDVTEQVLARKKLEQSEQRVRSLVESAPFPIGVYTGKEMRIELANQAIIDAYGKGPEVIGKKYAEVMPELNNQEVFEQLDGVFTTGVPFHAKNQRVDIVVNEKLQAYYFNYSFTPLHDASGGVYGVMNTAADVTDLNVANQKVEESERSLRNIILQAPVAMCLLRGPHYVVEIANDRMFELWGKRAEEVMNRPVFAGIPEAKEQGLETLLYNVYTTGEPFKAYERPLNFLRAGKVETTYVNFVYEPLYEKAGVISGILAVAVEVTEQVLARHKIEEVVAQRTAELAEANNALQLNNRELEQFAYIASHDLQEPLRKVSTFTEMLKTNLGEVDERSKMYLEKISASSSRMLQLIRDVLNFSQLSKDRDVFTPVDLNVVLDTLVTDFELLIDQKNATINYNGLPSIDAIPLQMQQLFSNLISNALKFTREGVPPVITITAGKLPEKERTARPGLLPDADYTLINVTDNGIGFNQEHAAQIFGIFQRLHGRSEYAGTGIGLALCKKIVQNHHGEIWATANIVKGSVFHIILPQNAVGKSS